MRYSGLKKTGHPIDILNSVKYDIYKLGYKLFIKLSTLYLILFNFLYYLLIITVKLTFLNFKLTYTNLNLKF